MAEESSIFWMRFVETREVGFGPTRGCVVAVSENFLDGRTRRQESFRGLTSIGLTKVVLRNEINCVEA